MGGYADKKKAMENAKAGIKPDAAPTPKPLAAQLPSAEPIQKAPVAPVAPVVAEPAAKPAAVALVEKPAAPAPVAVAPEPVAAPKSAAPPPPPPGAKGKPIPKPTAQAPEEAKPAAKPAAAIEPKGPDTDELSTADLDSLKIEPSPSLAMALSGDLLFPDGFGTSEFDVPGSAPRAGGEAAQPDLFAVPDDLFGAVEPEVPSPQVSAPDDMFGPVESAPDPASVVAEPAVEMAAPETAMKKNIVTVAFRNKGDSYPLGGYSLTFVEMASMFTPKLSLKGKGINEEFVLEEDETKTFKAGDRTLTVKDLGVDNGQRNVEFTLEAPDKAKKAVPKPKKEVAESDKVMNYAPQIFGAAAATCFSTFFACLTDVHAMLSAAFVPVVVVFYVVSFGIPAWSIISKRKTLKENERNATRGV